MSLDPNKTYLTWNGSEFPNSSNAMFKAPAGSVIDWGDGTVESFETASETVNTHTYTDGKDTHTIAISGLISIGGNAFSQCYSLTSIVIGNGITSIGYFAFFQCYSLTSIVIPDSVTSIGEDAFYHCSSLTSIVIPDSVTSIDKRAFNGCSNLKTIILFPETPPTLGSNAIPTTISKIYVQKSSKALYKAATNWTTFANKIVSNNIYLSFIRFNQKNKKYIDEKFDYLNDNTGALLDFSIDNTTFVLTATLKNANGEILGTPQTIDLPIESLVVNGNYDNDSKTLILTLQNGNTVDIPVSGLIDGLATLADLKNYVKFTDYANENKAGAVKINNAFGIRIDTNGALYLDTANDNEISNQQGYTAIKTHQIPKAVKSGLVKHDDITLTDEEKTSACDWIGAIKKDTSTSNLLRLYAINPDGSQTVLKASTVREGNAIVRYSANGCIDTGDPYEDYHAANKKYVDDGFVAKYNRSSAEGYEWFVYVQDSQNNDSVLELLNKVRTGVSTIPFRDFRGCIAGIGTPLNDDDAANKKYVDELAIKVLTKEQIDSLF